MRVVTIPEPPADRSRYKPFPGWSSSDIRITFSAVKGNIVLFLFTHTLWALQHV